MLRPLERAEFATVATMLDLSEANLSKTVRNLVEIGYLTTSKQASPDRPDARQITTITLTPSGRVAFDGHLAALHAMAGE